MIVTDLARAAEQFPPLPGLHKALAYLQAVRAAPPADGRVDLDGDRVYALVQSYTTQPGEPTFEAHRRYLDVQYVAAGEEIIAWALLDQMVVDLPYDDAKDVCHGRVPPALVTPLRLSAGQLAVLYPSDAHAARVAAGPPAPVKKIVVKVALSGADLS